MGLEVDSLYFHYRDRPVLQGVTCSMQPGEVIGIIGPNGAGKSTLLKCMLALLKPQRGQVRWEGIDIRSIGRKRRATLQGYVPQQAIVTFRVPVMEMVLLGRKPYIRFAPRARDFAVVESILHYLNLHEMAHRPVIELSGGERQKVMLARALAQEPAALFLDEPTAALDIAHQLEVLSLVQKLAHDQGKLVVLVLHDLALAARFSDRLLLMEQGRIFASGLPSSVLTTDNLRRVYGVEAEVRPGRFGPEITVIGLA
ncbi:MAG: ABC transporter ATP-binding protein [Caldilinea sp.]|nr:ABC transporter ATP-binding protein [Caldilinea sp.]MDW8440500.1 ABC transporter ATP-binding protein [Caldilineaceae bacterium]